MSSGDSDSASESSRHRPFATTRWSIVVAAGGHASTESQEALATLFQSYWYPLYAYVRRRGYQPAEAQDLTQAFFAQLLEKGVLAAADQKRGKFRSFLLASLNHFLANQNRAARAEKRGGGKTVHSLDFADGERLYGMEPADHATPEQIFQRRWAMTLLHRAVDKLHDEYEQSNRLHVFEALKCYLGGETGRVPYREIAQQLEATEGAIKVAVHRLRRRCRELLRQEIAHTVDSPDDIDEELQNLFLAIQA
jgi:RNA polymerase sigma-70 factor (ECF subfamily)